MTDKKQNDSSLTIPENRGVISRSTDLVRRGLNSIATKQGDWAVEADYIQERFVEIADSMIHSGKYVEAAELLMNGVALMPRNWKPAVDSADFIEIAFWNDSEFEAYIELHSCVFR